MAVETMDELLSNALNDVEKGFKQQVFNTYEKQEQSDIGKWTGKVIDNDDPEKLGRVKIVVFGYYDELPESALPWAIPDLGYVGGTNGNFIIPEVGTFVRGYFDQGDIQKPIYDGVAFTEMTSKNILKNQLINKTEDYPNKMVLMETDQGDYMTMNRANGEMELQHRTGLNITIGADGSITINTGSNYSNLAGGVGNVTINTDGNTEINSTGNINIKAERGSVNIDSTLADINLGRNPMKQLINNLPICPVTGIQHCIGNTNVKC